MKFVMSYSCGKDSTLALHRMVQAGHTPVCLLVMVNRTAGRSYFHGADGAMLTRYEDALGLPILRCPSDGPDYHLSFEDGLRRARALGAEGAAFGDIDLEGHRQWDIDRCAAAGLTPYFPLWQQGREALVRECVALGYKCVIKSVTKGALPVSFLGRVMDEETIGAMAAEGIDVCGENGEYHTLAVDGPVFRHPLAYTLGDVVDLGSHAVIDIR